MTKQNEELPPGQRPAPRIWPDVGEREPKPLGEGEVWRVSVVGRVDEETTWTVDELRAMPQVE